MGEKILCFVGKRLKYAIVIRGIVVWKVQMASGAVEDKAAGRAMAQSDTLVDTTALSSAVSAAREKQAAARIAELETELAESLESLEAQAATNLSLQAQIAEMDDELATCSDKSIGSPTEVQTGPFASLPREIEELTESRGRPERI